MPIALVTEIKNKTKEESCKASKYIICKFIYILYNFIVK